MEITIRKIKTEYLNGDPESSDVTSTYLVIEDGKTFRIKYRNHVHGCSLSLEGQEGLLYTDIEERRVRRQVFTVGKICGISIECDEPVEGLSPRALRGIILAHRSNESGEIRFLFGECEESRDEPVILVDGKPVEWLVNG